MVESLSFWVRTVSVKTIVFIHKVRNTVKYDGTRDTSDVDWRADTDHIGTAHVGKRSLARQSTSQLGFRHLALAFVSSVVNCSASGGACSPGNALPQGHGRSLSDMVSADNSGWPQVVVSRRIKGRAERFSAVGEKRH